MLDYKLLQALANVVREGGFDKASQRLNITQSAVSQRIKLLENHIGVNLYWHRWNLRSLLLDKFSKAIVKNAVIC